MYDMGYPNNNCIGCVKGGMGYWNHIRKDFPEVFDSRAKLEREDFGYSTNKYNEGTISKLDLVQVRENVLYTDQQVVNDKINCLVDYIGLYKAVGSQL